jgi:hypothetical protein
VAVGSGVGVGTGVMTGVGSMVASRVDVGVAPSEGNVPELDAGPSSMDERVVHEATTARTTPIPTSDLSLRRWACCGTAVGFADEFGIRSPLLRHEAG